MQVITSTGNAAVKAARKLARRRDRGGDELLVEGPQAVAEAVERLERLFVTEEAAHRHAVLVDAARSRGADVTVVTPDVLAALASTSTPQGVVAVASLPMPDLDGVLEAARLVVVCHQVRDPGNAGTIIRTADAAGADAVVLTRGSVDARNPKAVRASAGSLFHLPVVDGPTWSEVVSAARAHGIAIVAAQGGSPTSVWEADLAGRVALVFGNEARGLDATALRDSDQVVRVPMHDAPRAGYHGRVESLNLAATAAVVVYEAVRQRAQDPRGAAVTGAAR